MASDIAKHIVNIVKESEVALSSTISFQIQDGKEYKVQFIPIDQNLISLKYETLKITVTRINKDAIHAFVKQVALGALLDAIKDSKKLIIRFDKLSLIKNLTTHNQTQITIIMTAIEEWLLILSWLSHV